jgi:cytosine/adenosine deaminase-related metal-dependent hydrolase
VLPACLFLLNPADIKARALLFFDSLSRSGTGSARSSASAVAGASASNPVYNLLPDMLSALVREPGLREEQFRGIMAVLLLMEYVKVGGWGWWGEEGRRGAAVGVCAGGRN